MDTRAQNLLTSLFEAAIKAADPLEALVSHLPAPPKGRTVVIGAGKGAAQMAAALEQLWDAPLTGTVVTRYGFGAATQHIKVLEASHPVPDAAGLAATEALIAELTNLTTDDLVIALVCGGGSSLLAAPADGLTLEDEQALNQTLLASGAPIGAMNAIRKMFSRVKGGRLIANTAAPVVSLIVSDVPGDDPAQVASGPTVPCASGRKEALAAVARYNIALPPRLAAYLATAPAPPKPTDRAFLKNEVHVIASAARSLAAAADIAKAEGWPVDILGDDLQGEARILGTEHAALALAAKGPRLILSGGETTVTLQGKGGHGGRNTEYLLALALAIKGAAHINALAADTDGIDGSEDNAGAFATGQTAAAMRNAGIDPAAALAANDAYTAFAAADALFVTGPTGTNVNDFRAILIGWP
ncbi:MULTISPECIES: glycerate kinase type-2 family protein [Lentibacter]|jgi:glycerate 2-kinase|uniref:Glycerate 2-kinase n=3 Tax=Lentibacter algarum TaxID=576131 RepID=A0A1H3GU64_9RHOB|nr:glycerate kinase [Lentibacter algarum]WIF30521.1 putative hydroxypyruvate reductase [Lentibacter algarum]SDY06801.1 glycerate 2-kinase [Lentibacter algarum]